MLEYYDRVVITADEGVDVTHSVALSIAHSYKFLGEDGDMYIYARGAVTTIDNEQYVQDYELCMAPTQFMTVAGKGTDSDTGISGGTVIPAGYYMIKTDHTGDAMLGFDFEIRVPESALADRDAGHRYTFFVKTNYKPLPQGFLAPTFHSLVPAEIQTSVAEVDASLLSVTAMGGEIVIDSLSRIAVDVYDLSGAAVYRGSDSRIAVARGAYVVKAGTQEFKILVK